MKTSSLDKIDIQDANPEFHRHKNLFLPPLYHPSCLQHCSKNRRPSRFSSPLPYPSPFAPMPQYLPSISCDTHPIAPVFGPWVPMVPHNPTLQKFAAYNLYLLDGTRCVPSSPYICLYLTNHPPSSLQITFPAPPQHIDNDAMRNRGIIHRYHCPAPLSLHSQPPPRN
jgi:hypothetical protein